MYSTRTLELGASGNFLVCHEEIMLLISDIVLVYVCIKRRAVKAKVASNFAPLVWRTRRSTSNIHGNGCGKGRTVE